MIIKKIIYSCLLFILISTISTTVLFNIDKNENIQYKENLIEDQINDINSIKQAILTRIDNVTNDILFLKTLFEKD